MLDIICSVTLILFGQDVRFFEAMNLTKRGNFEQSEKLLKQIDPNRSGNRDVYNFYRYLNNFSMNQRKEAQKWVFYLEQESGLPERYRVLSMLMQMEMEQWKKDDLGDIARDMSHIKNRLQHAYAGKETQKLQQSVIDRLDKLIKEKEDKGDGSANSSSEQQKSKPKQIQNPLEESRIADDSGPGHVNIVKMRKTMEKWGSLPPREQARALQELTQGMSPRHREAIENYFRNLATTKKR